MIFRAFSFTTLTTPIWLGWTQPTCHFKIRHFMTSGWRSHAARSHFPSTSIKEDFGARYIVTDLQHTEFLDQAALDPALEEVYRDHDAVILEVNTT